MLMTCAPLSAAQIMPLAIQVVAPEPESLSTLTFMRLACGATPLPPSPLLAVAATMPATWVPWPYMSSTEALSVMFLLATILLANSG